MPKAEQLPEIRPPRSVEGNPEAIELMRMWWLGEGAEMVFRPAFENPRSFGFLLAEALRHLAQVYAAKRDIDPGEAHRLILEGWSDGLAVEMTTRMEPTGGAAAKPKRASKASSLSRWSRRAWTSSCPPCPPPWRRGRWPSGW